MREIPKARTNNILIQELENEVLIYDLEINKAYCLNQTSSIVWQNCDGKVSLNALADNLGIAEDLIMLTLNELKKYGLLENQQFRFNQPLLTRRKALLNAISLGIALPVITTLVAPRAANALSAVCGINNNCDCTLTPADFKLGDTCPSNDCAIGCNCTLVSILLDPLGTPIGQIKTCL